MFQEAAWVFVHPLPVDCELDLHREEGAVVLGALMADAQAVQRPQTA